MAPSEFTWLTDLHKYQCYTTGDWTNPSKSIDFGDNGHTASLTDWHELLQLTAPDPLCGIVFVRGDFPNTADAILARAQQPNSSGKKGTLGLEIDSKASDFALGERRNQGFVNFRWPYIQYELKRKYSDGGVEQIHIGTYEAISFVKDNIVFQVICLRPGRLQEESGGAAKNAKSSIQDRHKDQVTATEEQWTDESKKLKIRFKLGGHLQFGCPCSSGSPPEDEATERAVDDVYQFESRDNGKRLACVSSWYQKRLEIQLFVNDESKIIHPIRSREALTESLGGKFELSAIHDVELVAGASTCIVATYALRDSLSADPILKADSFKSIANYLGVPDSSEKMSDRLWTACLTTNYDAGEAMEFCAIGTAVEQTLCVSSIPLALITSNSGSSPEMTPIHNQENEKIALVRNIMVGQYVDLQSTFWQIRLLVKVHEFLRSRRFEPDLLNPIRSLNDVRNSYLKMLRSHLRKVLIWLMEANVEPGKIMLPINSTKEAETMENGMNFERLKHCSYRRSLIKIDSSYNQACFVTLAVWFVMKYCPEAATTEFKARFVLPALNKLYRDGDTQDSRAENDSTAKNNVLQWFHMSCVLLICQESFGRDSENQDIDGFSKSGLSRKDINRSQERCEKSIIRLRKAKTETYSIEDEEVDRLFLLAEELGLSSSQSQASSSLAIARAKQTRAKVAERKPTIRFHPGPRPSKAGDVSRVISNGPWELSCLNHHTLLRTTLDRSSEISVQACRDACFEFLLSDYSFISSWDRADKAMIEKWWDFETGSVICATIIDLKTAGILKSAEPERKVEDLTGSITNLAIAPIEVEGQTNQYAVPRADINRVDSLRDLLQLLKQELTHNDTGSNVSNRAFDWLAWKPAIYYHPRCWVQVINGIEKVSKLKSMKKLPPQLEIIKYLSGKDEQKLSQSIEWHMKEIGQVLWDDLNYISIYDLVAQCDFTFKSRELRSMTINGTVIAPSNSRQQQRSSTDWRSVQSSLEKTLTTLNRTLVDSETKYRILFAERCCPSLLKAFICGWHPDALDTFDNYFGTSSRFSDTREAMWTTTITISHWSIRSTDYSKEYPERFHEGRTKGDFPPPNIAKLILENGKAKESKLENEKTFRVIEERSSSLVITGDSHGFFWLCTIWSSLTKHKHLAVSVNSLPAVLHSFINQQASGRCLVFLILLGHLCERLAKEHERMLSQLNTVVDLGEKILLEGIELEASDAVEKLKKMLWGLEALRVFDDRLSTSLSQIRKARETLEHTIDQEAGQQDIELIQEYKNVLEEFGKRYGILLDVQIKIQLRIRQVAGLRDGISTVTNVQDSRTTIKQGNNIRVLTLITIAYLPLGFVTASGLFSVNKDVLPSDAGTTLYVVLNVVLSLITYLVALGLGTILNVVQPGWDMLKDKFLPSNAESIDTATLDISTKRAESDRSRNRSRSTLSGSPRGPILPLVKLNGKEHESSDTVV